jgi:hypothetical protein
MQPLTGIGGDVGVEHVDFHSALRWVRWMVGAVGYRGLDREQISAIKWPLAAIIIESKLYDRPVFRSTSPLFPAKRGACGQITALMAICMI